MKAYSLVILIACGKSAPPAAPPLSGSAPPPPTDAAAPEGLTVTSIEPVNGDFEGGTYVVIKGSHFISEGPRNVKVFFGSRQGIVVRFASDRELIVQAPAGKENEVVDVLLVFEPGGEKKLPRAFTYVHKQ